jgi:hypothetical protein
MKQLTTLLILLSLPNFANSQVNFDFNWILGRPTPADDTTGRYGGSLVDFNFMPAKYSKLDIIVSMDANVSISDSFGNLLFYTDGCAVINRNHEVMANGSGINEGGLIYQQDCLTNTYGYPTHQGVMILPFPGHSNQYVLLHLRKPDPIYPLFIEDFLYSVINMTGDGGLGSVISKNNLIKHDTFCDMLTAVRHGNGRDWWIVIPRLNTSEYYIFLLSPQGINAPVLQKIGYPITQYSWGLQAVFSPDGTKYANHTWFGGLQVFDFDRCAGVLSNPVHITFPGDTVSGCGVAFSSTSRFLYASNTLKLYQFDLRVDGLEASKQLVGAYDGFANYLPTTFYQMKLAPDNKIYMTCTSGTKYWHIIHYPDKKGIDCNLEQHFELPRVHGFSPPNFPYFRLFDAQGSPCDTLGINGPPPPQDTTPPPPKCAASIKIYPNPTQSVAYLELPDCQGGSLSIFDVTGRWVEDLPLAPESLSTSLDVSRYVPGVYFLLIRTAAGEKVTRRLVVVR